MTSEQAASLVALVRAVRSVSPGALSQEDADAMEATVRHTFARYHEMSATIATIAEVANGYWNDLSGRRGLAAARVIRAEGALDAISTALGIPF